MAVDMVAETGTFMVKSGLAQMLKGGVIMDVVTPEHAKIAEDAGGSGGDGTGARPLGHSAGWWRGAHV